MMKNMPDMSMGALSFWLIGFGVMFGATNGYFGTDHFLLSPDNGTGDGQWKYTFWMFRVVFAATAATIVSGAMAQRTKFAAYLVYSVLITAIVYSVFAHWTWGNLLLDQPSWLADMGFIDLAGSTVVDSVGGWAALAGAIVIGAISGILVIYSVLFFDRIKVDDPVNAISVHGVCVARGTLPAALLH